MGAPTNDTSQIDVVFLDSENALARVSRQKLLLEVSRNIDDDQLNRWLEAYLVEKTHLEQ